MIQNLFIRPIILFLLLLMGIATVKGETEEFPNTLQATGTLKLDTVTLHYKLNLHLTAPEQNSYGELHVYVGEGQQPVQTYYVTKVQNGWPEGKKLTFQVPDDLYSKKVRYSRVGTLEYNSYRNDLRVTLDYAMYPGKFDTYLSPLNPNVSLQATIYPEDQRLPVEITWPSQPDPEQWKKEVEAANDTSGFWQHQIPIMEDVSVTPLNILWIVIRGLIFLLLIIYFIVMLPKAKACGQIAPLAIIISIILFVNINGIYPMLPLIPGFLIGYPLLYKWEYPGSFHKVLRVIMYPSIALTFIFSVIVYSTLGTRGMGHITTWIATDVIFWYLFSIHLGKSCCRRCGKYGRHEMVGKEFVKRLVKASSIHLDKFDHTEVKTTEIIHWFKRTYGVRLRITDIYNVYYKCRKCNQIFLNREEKMTVKDVY